MAIVVDKARPELGTDQNWNSWNRTNAGEPNGTLTPEFVGELAKDTTNNVLWKAIGPGINDWVQMTAG